MDVVQAFPKAGGAYYDLACCEAVLGNIDLARGWLREAFRLDAGFRESVRTDADLASLRAKF